MTPDFWRHRRVFLTGHTGFKGSWLSLWLQMAGAELTGYALSPPTDPSLFELGRVADGMHSVIGDVRDLPSLLAAMRTAEPEVVIHMAAQPLVRRSYQDPVETFTTNVTGTVNLLEAVRQTPGVRTVLVVTSDKCYHNDGRTRGYVEGDPLGGSDPYSASKAACELVVGSYRSTNWLNQGGPALASARGGNVIGGGDWAPDRLVPDMMRTLLAGEPLVVRYPDAVRPWQHVLDCLNGYLVLCERLTAEPVPVAGAWNFGPDVADARTVASLLSTLGERWGGQATWRRADGVQPPEAHHLQLDCSKARTQLGWRPRLGLDAALDLIVEWYRAYDAAGDIPAVTRRQIAAFQESQ